MKGIVALALVLPLAPSAYSLPTWDFTGYQVDRPTVQVVASAYGTQISEVSTKTGLTSGIDPNMITSSAYGFSLDRSPFGGFTTGSANVSTYVSFADGNIAYGVRSLVREMHHLFLRQLIFL